MKNGNFAWITKLNVEISRCRPQCDNWRWKNVQNIRGPKKVIKGPNQKKLRIMFCSEENVCFVAQLFSELSGHIFHLQLEWWPSSPASDSNQQSEKQKHVHHITSNHAKFWQKHVHHITSSHVKFWQKHVHYITSNPHKALAKTCSTYN